MKIRSGNHIRLAENVLGGKKNYRNRIIINYIIYII